MKWEVKPLSQVEREVGVGVGGHSFKQKKWVVEHGVFKEEQKA